MNQGKHEPLLFHSGNCRASTRELRRANDIFDLVRPANGAEGIPERTLRHWKRRIREAELEYGHDVLPAPVADRYFLVSACLAPVAHAPSDIVWSASIPHCRRAPIPTKRSWFSKLAHRETAPTLRVVEHYSPEEGRQGVGAEFFRQRYLQ